MIIICQSGYAASPHHISPSPPHQIISPSSPDHTERTWQRWHCVHNFAKFRSHSTTDAIFIWYTSTSLDLQLRQSEVSPAGSTALHLLEITPDRARCARDAREEAGDRARFARGVAGDRARWREIARDSREVAGDSAHPRHWSETFANFISPPVVGVACGVAEIQPRYSRDTAEIQPRYSRDRAEI